MGGTNPILKGHNVGHNRVLTPITHLREVPRNGDFNAP
jgi:hypothetical protein